MNRQFLLLSALISIIAGLTAYRPAEEPKPGEQKIKWMSIKEAFEANQKKPKKFVIDVYTDWCGWCKVMDRETFTKPAIVDYVNENYYAVKLNAEQKEEIILGQRTYKSLGNVHELAATLLNGQMSYPTTVFLNEKMEMIQPVPGYLEPRIFHQITTFFGGNHNQKEAFDQFRSGTYVQKYQAAMPVVAPAAQPVVNH